MNKPDFARNQFLLIEYPKVLTSLGFNAQVAATIVLIAYREMKWK